MVEDGGDIRGLNKPANGVCMALRVFVCACMCACLCVCVCVCVCARACRDGYGDSGSDSGGEGETKSEKRRKRMMDQFFESEFKKRRRVCTPINPSTSFLLFTYSLSSSSPGRQY